MPITTNQSLVSRRYGGSHRRSNGVYQTSQTGMSGCIFVSRKAALLGSIACVGWTVAGISALQGWIGVGISTSILMVSLVFTLLRQVFGYWNCLPMLFWFAHALYAVSGPLYWYIQEESIFFYEHIKYADFYVSFCALASLGFVLGVLLPTFRQRRYDTHAISRLLNPYALRASSIVLLIAAFVLEMSRLIQPQYREALTLGKVYVGFYEGYSSPIILHLIYTSALLAIFFITQRQIPRTTRVKFSLLWLLLCSPTLITSLIIGGRGVFINLFFVLLFATFFFEKIKKINLKILIMIAFMYLVFVTMFWARGVTGSLITGDISIGEFVDTVVRHFNLSPVTVEFAAPFVNFNIFYASADALSFRYGETYIDGILSVLEYLAHGKLRPHTTEQFHQIFYPEALEGGYGYGFSSIVEAYWNFGTAGIFIVYFLFGILLSTIEITVNLKKFSTIHIIYINLIPVAVIIHRSNLGLAFWLLPIAISAVSYLCYKVFEYFLSRRAARCE